MKANILKMKNDIKELVKIQIDTKRQRKTVKFTGTRTMDASEASYKAPLQKEELKTYYQAYSELRGRENSHGDVTLNNLYDNLLETYKHE